MFEIETDAGTVYAVNETLAAALAALVTDNARRSELDLLEAVRMPLDDFETSTRVLVA